MTHEAYDHLGIFCLGFLFAQVLRWLEKREANRGN